MSKRILVLSTGNENKVKEIKHILKDLKIEVLSKKDVNLENLEIIEDGETLEENSLKKAKTLADRTGYMVMADDTGLFVDALGGEPGVHAARYAGEEVNDKKNNEKLLSKLKGKSLEERKARFWMLSLLSQKIKKFIP